MWINTNKPWCCNPSCNNDAVFELGRPIPGDFSDPNYMEALEDYTHCCGRPECLDYLNESGYMKRKLNPDESAAEAISARTEKN